MTESKATPEQLASMILEQMHDAVIFVDRTGVIRLWNRGAEAIFGFTARDALGGSLDLIVPERFRSAHAAGFRQAVASGRLKATGRVLTTRANAKSGRRLYIDFSFGLLRNDQDELLGIFAVGRDATARHLGEAQGASSQSG